MFPDEIDQRNGLNPGIQQVLSTPVRLGASVCEHAYAHALPVALITEVVGAIVRGAG